MAEGFERMRQPERRRQSERMRKPERRRQSALKDMFIYIEI